MIDNARISLGDLVSPFQVFGTVNGLKIKLDSLGFSDKFCILMLKFYRILKSITW